MSRIPDSENRVSMEFSKQLADLIDEKKIDIPDYDKYKLAANAKVSKDIINRALTFGIIPSLQPLVRIADELNVSLLYLLGESDNPNFYKADAPKTFHERLEELASKKGVKYSEIARTMPFAENFFYEWKRRNHLPSREYLKAIADYFQVTMDYLLGRTDDNDFVKKQ